MLHELRSFFGEPQRPEIKLGELSRGDLRLAAALVLVCAALADQHFAASEHTALLDLLETKLQLPRAKAEQLVQEAGSKSESTVQRLMSLLREELTQTQREEVLGMAWAVLGAEQSVTNDEAAFAVSLRQQLGLSMEQALRARKLAEDVELDGFREIVDADPTVAEASQKPGRVRRD